MDMLGVKSSTRNVIRTAGSRQNQVRGRITQVNGRKPLLFEEPRQLQHAQHKEKNRNSRDQYFRVRSNAKLMQENEPSIKSESKRGWFSPAICNQCFGLGHQGIVAHSIIQVGIVVIAMSYRLNLKKAGRISYRLH